MATMAKGRTASQLPGLRKGTGELPNGRRGWPLSRVGGCHSSKTSLLHKAAHTECNLTHNSNWIFDELNGCHLEFRWVIKVLAATLITETCDHFRPTPEIPAAAQSGSLPRARRNWSCQAAHFFLMSVSSITDGWVILGLTSFPSTASQVITLPGTEQHSVNRVKQGPLPQSDSPTFQLVFFVTKYWGLYEGKNP